MKKCDFNKIAKQSNVIEITLRHGCSPVNLLHIFRTPFPKNTSGWLLLKCELLLVSQGIIKHEGIVETMCRLFLFHLLLNVWRHKFY